MHVYHARYISEDTNPWDSNESYGVYSTLKEAQEHAFSVFDDHDNSSEVISWVKTNDTYTGTGMVETWVRVEHQPHEEPYDDGSGYGMYIFKEELR